MLKYLLLTMFKWMNSDINWVTIFLLTSSLKVLYNCFSLTIFFKSTDFNLKIFLAFKSIFLDQKI